MGQRGLEEDAVSRRSERSRRTVLNPKRALAVEEELASMAGSLHELGGRAGYTGSSDHKRAPGDFGLHPPTSPRIGATLCDDAGFVSRTEALRLLREGFRRGGVSRQERNGWPQNVWAVTSDGVPLEAQLDNREQGTYHGYPMAENDPLRRKVLARWYADEKQPQ